jgi:hypothetical protein
MTKEKLNTAMEEAHRFITRADKCVAYAQVAYGSFGDSKLTSAVRRSSLDLTRALADLRRYTR